jgi:rubrerythrin
LVKKYRDFEKKYQGVAFMGIDFNICEIFSIANELEKNKADFFRKAAEKFRDTKIRDTLIEIADEDNYNAAVFARIEEGFTKNECPATVFDPDNVDHLYLKAMAEDHVCNFDACKNLVGNETLLQILQMAVRMEKDALVFYTGLKNFVSKSSLENLERIIQEKLKNIGFLSTKLDELE